MRVEMHGRRKEELGTQKFKHVMQCFHVMSTISVPALNEVLLAHLKTRTSF
jgi:hypothetical protein